MAILKASYVFPGMTLFENICFTALQSVLDNNDIPSHYYHFGEYAEECVCLEKIDHDWLVYIGEHGEHSNAISYSDMRSACIALLDNVAETEDQFRKMRAEFILCARKNTAQTMKAVKIYKPKLKKPITKTEKRSDRKKTVEVSSQNKKEAMIKNVF